MIHRDSARDADNNNAWLHGSDRRSFCPPQLLDDEYAPGAGLSRELQERQYRDPLLFARIEVAVSLLDWWERVCCAVVSPRITCRYVGVDFREVAIELHVVK